MKSLFSTLIIFLSFSLHAIEDNIVDHIYILNKPYKIVKKTYITDKGKLVRNSWFWVGNFEVDEDMIYMPLDEDCLNGVCKSKYIIVHDENNNDNLIRKAFTFFPENYVAIGEDKIGDEEKVAVKLSTVILHEVEDSNCRKFCVNDFVTRGKVNKSDLKFYSYLTADFNLEKFNIRPPFDPYLGQIVAKLNNGYYLFAFKPENKEVGHDEPIEFVIGRKGSYELVH